MFWCCNQIEKRSMRRSSSFGKSQALNIDLDSGIELTVVSGFNLDKSFLRGLDPKGNRPSIDHSAEALVKFLLTSMTPPGQSLIRSRTKTTVSRETHPGLLVATTMDHRRACTAKLIVRSRTSRKKDRTETMVWLIKAIDDSLRRTPSTARDTQCMAGIPSVFTVRSAQSFRLTTMTPPG